jgi:hypothetical protein
LIWWQIKSPMKPMGFVVPTTLDLWVWAFTICFSCAAIDYIRRIDSFVFMFMHCQAALSNCSC